MDIKCFFAVLLHKYAMPDIHSIYHIMYKVKKYDSVIWIVRYILAYESKFENNFHGDITLRKIHCDEIQVIFFCW